MIARREAELVEWRAGRQGLLIVVFISRLGKQAIHFVGGNVTARAQPSGYIGTQRRTALDLAEEHLVGDGVGLNRGPLLLQLISYHLLELRDQLRLLLQNRNDLHRRQRAVRGELLR